MYSDDQEANQARMFYKSLISFSRSVWWIPRLSYPDFWHLTFTISENLAFACLVKIRHNFKFLLVCHVAKLSCEK